MKTYYELTVWNDAIFYIALGSTSEVVFCFRRNWSFLESMLDVEEWRSGWIGL